MIRRKELEQKGQNTLYKRISTKITRSSQLEMMREERNITMPPLERKNRSWIVGKERIEKKMTTSATNELGKHPCKEELNVVVGKSRTKSTSLLWAYGKHLKMMR